MSYEVITDELGYNIQWNLLTPIPGDLILRIDYMSHTEQPILRSVLGPPRWGEQFWSCHRV